MSTIVEPPPAAATERAEPRVDTLADGVFLLLVLTVVQRLVGFGRGILFCRWIDAEELGQWDVAFGGIVLLAPLIVLGLPGCFARYVEPYRQRRQLRSFLNRVMLVTGGLTLLGCSLMAVAADWFSKVIFGRNDQSRLVLLLAVCLVGVIAFNFLTELFNGLRRYRVVTGLQFWNSILFAALGVGLLQSWEPTAASVIVAYGAACLLTALGGLVPLFRSYRELPPTPAAATRIEWPKLLAFSGWIWLTSFLWNLFDLVDRVMIVHFSQTSPAEALVLVGEYHSSRVVPLLLMSLALMLGTMLTPHLSRDWERGDFRRVGRQMNLALKLTALALTAAGAGILLLSPVLFNVAFSGKFAAGAELMPATLTYCIWGGLAAVAINYLWCAEHGGLGSLTCLAGLVVNVLLNLWLLPRYGLMGAVWATLAAKLVALLLTYWFSSWLEMRFDGGTWLLSAAPAALCLGPWITLAVLAVIGIGIARSDRLLTADDKAELAAVWSRYARKFGFAPQPIAPESVL